MRRIAGPPVTHELVIFYEVFYGSLTKREASVSSRRSLLHSLHLTRTAVILLVVVTTGSVLRILSVLETKVDHPIRGDSIDYFFYAYNLRHSGVYSRSTESYSHWNAAVPPDAFRSPGYPLFLTVFINGDPLYVFKGGEPNNDILVRITLSQAIISTVTLFGVFYVSRGFLPDALALGATALAALSPHLIVMNSYVLTETLFCALVVLLAYLLKLCHRGMALGLSGLIGIVLAAASLVRPTLEYFLLPLGVFILFSTGIRKGMRMVGMIVLGFSLLYGPWIARNLHTLGAAGDKGLMIGTLLHGMYPDFMYEDNPNTYGSPYRFDPHFAEFNRSLKTAVSEILRRFSMEPVAHLNWYLIGKPATFWSWNEVQGAGDAFVFPVEQTPYWDSPLFWATHGLMKFIHWPLVLFGAVGFVLAWVPKTRCRIEDQALFVLQAMALLLGYFTVLHMVGTPLPRYATPIRPVLFGVAMLPFSLWLRAKGLIHTRSLQARSISSKPKRRSRRS